MLKQCKKHHREYKRKKGVAILNTDFTVEMRLCSVMWEYSTNLPTRVCVGKYLLALWKWGVSSVLCYSDDLEEEVGQISWSTSMHCYLILGLHLHFKDDFCDWVVFGRLNPFQEDLKRRSLPRGSSGLSPRSHLWPKDLPSMSSQGEDCYFFFYSTCTKVRIGLSNLVLWFP